MTLGRARCAVSLFHGLLATWTVAVPAAVLAQSMRLDRAYRPTVALVGEAWAQMSVRVLADGRFLCSGRIDLAGDESRPQIARLLAEGTADLSFHFEPPLFMDRGGDFPILGPLVELANGMLVCARSAAIVSPGGPLSGYPPSALYTYYVQILVLEPDGAVVPGRGGYFLGSSAGLTPTPQGGCVVWGPLRAEAAGSRDGLVARIAPDGTWDEGFQAAISNQAALISGVAPAADGKTVVAYAMPSGDPYEGYGDIVIARLDAAGALDPSFIPAVTAHSLLAVDADRRVLVDGSPLSRLNEDGSVDASFAPELGAMSLVNEVWLLPGSHLLVNGQDPDGAQLIRVLAHDGTLVRNLGPLVEPGRKIEILDVDSQGTCVLRNRTRDNPGVPTADWVRFGRLPLGDAQPQAWTPDVARVGAVESIVRTSGDTLIVRGVFDHVDGVFGPGLARLDAAGEADAGYSPAWVSRDAEYVAVAPDGGVYVRYTEGGGDAPSVRHVRLRADGAIDETFPADSALAQADVTIRRIEEDGAVLTSAQIDDAEQPYISYQRFDDDGRLVDAWPLADLTTGAWRVSSVQDMVRDPQGRLVVTGVIASAQGAQRYLPTGELDAGYQADLGPAGSVEAITLLGDGRLLVSEFREKTALRSAHRALIRLDSDGRLDPAWRVLEAEIPYVWEPVHPQADGCIVGESLDGRMMARWREDGSRDLGWDAIELPTIDSAVTLADGAVCFAARRALLPESRGNLYRVAPIASEGILVQPRPQSVFPTQTIALQVDPGARGPVGYQWYRDGERVEGATDARLIIDDARRGDAGAYRVEVTIGARTYVSDVAAVEVLSRQSRIVNFSARSHVAEGSAPQIGGFVLGGDGSPHQVLLRAIGGGLSDSLATGELLWAPRLRLFERDEVIAQDEGSALSDTIVPTANRVGAFAPVLWSPLPGIWRNDDSALLVPIQRGIYTAQTTASDMLQKRDGVSLFEFYDASDSADTDFVTNVSLRGRAGTDARSMIGGFVLQGTGPADLLIRVVGAELADFGVPGSLDDPRLRLFDQTTRVWLGDNDDWSDLDRAWIESAGRSVGAFPLQEGSRSAALRAVLAPGAYTVVVERGATSTESADGGEVLLEVYTVDE